MPDQATVQYYDIHAQEYIQRTCEMEMGPIRTSFLKYLKPGAHILDAGCGSGRDALAFLKQGYSVFAIDAAEGIISHVRSLGIPASCMAFEEMNYVSAFDGIWSSASLLHIHKNELTETIERMGKALKPEGIWFISFKLGQGEKFENGRYFHFLQEQELREYFKAFEILEIWSYESKINLSPTIWLNAILRKN